MIRVTLVCSPAPRTVHERTLELPDDASVAEALEASGLKDSMAPSLIDAMQPGVWGRAVDWSQLLQDGDRVERRRALTADPKVARRERFARQGARATGLFARRRAGAKAGY